MTSSDDRNGFTLDASIRSELMKTLGFEDPGRAADSPEASAALSRIQTACHLYRSKAAHEPLSELDRSGLETLDSAAHSLIEMLDGITVNARATLSAAYGVSFDNLIEVLQFLRSSTAMAKTGSRHSMLDDEDVVEEFFLERLIDVFFSFSRDIQPKEYEHGLGRKTKDSLRQFITVCLGAAGWRGGSKQAEKRIQKRYLELAHRYARRRVEETQAQRDLDSTDSGRGSDNKSGDDTAGTPDECASTPKRSRKWNVTVYYHEPTFDARRGERVDHVCSEFVCSRDLPGVEVDTAIDAYSGVPDASGVSWVREVSKVVVELGSPDDAENPGKDDQSRKTEASPEDIERQ